jgi:hypothetical protein
VQIATAKAEIERLADAGSGIELVMDCAQPYAWVRGTVAPTPPWDRATYDILIAIPLAYDLGTGLDGFYLDQPYSFNGSEHNRVNGQTLTLGGRQWRRCLGITRTGRPSGPESILSKATFSIAGDSSWPEEPSMHEFDLRIRESDWARLRKHCAPSFRGRKDTEIGAIGLVGKRMFGRNLRELIVTQVLWPERGEVLAEPGSALTFTSRYLRRAHLAMRKTGLAGLVTFHTHPLARSEVSFSWYDDEQDPLLIENLQELCPSTLLSSVVLGVNSQKGRLWLSPTEQLASARLIVVGDSVEYLPLDGRKAKVAPVTSEIFDRATALTGSGTLAVLSGMTIAVIGASGTGSLVCELLARAGCRRILLIDHDIVKQANLNRILHATRDDAERRRYKVEVLRRGIEALGLGCEVVPVVGSILDNTVLERLNEADLLIGCIDKDYPRMILCKYAYQHHLPYIDVGAEIGGDEEGIVSTDARVNYIAPGRWCLRCTGLVTSRRLAFESLTGAERTRKIALGYSDDLVIKQPAVMDLNMRAASAGVMLLRHLLQPFLRTPIPVTLAENLVTYNMKPVAAVRNRNEGCDICQANARSGFGDCGEPVGLSSDVAAALLDGQDETS